MPMSATLGSVSLIRSFGFALEGISYLIRTQRSAQIEIAIGAAVLALAAWLRITAIEWAVRPRNGARPRARGPQHRDRADRDARFAAATPAGQGRERRRGRYGAHRCDRLSHRRLRDPGTAADPLTHVQHCPAS